MLGRTTIEKDDRNYLVSDFMDTDEAKEWEQQAAKLLRNIKKENN